MTGRRILIAFSLWIASVRAVLGGEQVPPGWEEVGAIFAARCINCHSALGAAKGLRLDSYVAVLAGSADGAVVLPGDPAGSELIRRLRGESTPRMPFLSTPLPQGEIDLIVRWIEAGGPEKGMAAADLPD